MVIVPRCVLLPFFFVSLFFLPSEAAETLFVSPAGNDSWTGKIVVPNGDRSEGPFATLEAARDAIRRLKKRGGLPTGGVVVELAAGSYERSHAFELTNEDSGTAESPITYRAAKGAEVRLLGGKIVAAWKPVADPAVLAQLDPAARGKVLQADVKSLGITDFGQVSAGGLELFFRNQPAQIARWPNEGFVKIRDVTAESPNESHGRKGSKVGKFHYDGDRPSRWEKEADLWLHGYWFWDWRDEYQRVAKIDPSRQLIELAKPDHVYGYLRGARYYALNALAEIDQPGEWQLNRTTGILYFWPPSPIEAGQAIVSVLPALVVGKDVSYVTLRGLTCEATRGTPIKFDGGTNTRVVGCTIRNTGGGGIELVHGTKNAVLGCDIYNTAAGGITLSGGDRATLAPGGNVAENNHIHHYSRWVRTYSPAVTVDGVGNQVRHNLFHDAPHNAVQIAGNEHVIEFNEFHHVCLETDDVGAFYMGRDWTQRGNIVRYNYFHHLGKSGGGVGVMAIYLDDWSSGTTILGNVCYKAGRAVLIGGGRDNTVENNVFVDCSPSVHVDSRGLGWAKYYFNGSENTLVERLKAVDYRHPPWSTRYPQLLTLYDDEPALAKGNVVVRNISVGGRWLDLLDHLTDTIVKVQDNLVDKDPKFVDREHGDFRLRDDSPALSLGFKPIPVEKIGLYKSDDRATWPVAASVDPRSGTK